MEIFALILAIFGLVMGFVFVFSLYEFMTDTYFISGTNNRKDALRAALGGLLFTAFCWGGAYGLLAEAQWERFFYQWRVIFGVIFLILGFVSAIGSVLFALPETTPERLKGVLGSIGLAVLTVGLWGLAVYLWDISLIILLIILGIVSLLGTVIAFIFAFDDSTPKRFLAGLGGTVLLVLSGFLWLCAVAYFRGIETLNVVPEYFTALISLAVSIPWSIWLGTILSTIILTLIFRFGLSVMSESAWSGGSEIDTSHSWTDYRGFRYGHGTRQEVYDHYHGRGSWYSMIEFSLFLGKLAVIFLPVLIPLVVIQLIGWHDFFSADGILLSIVLTIISAFLTLPRRL